MLQKAAATSLHASSCNINVTVSCRNSFKAIFAQEKPEPGFYFTTLSITCATDEHGAAEGDTSSATRMNPHRQWFNQSPLLISHIIRQPGQFNFKSKRRRSALVQQSQYERLRKVSCRQLFCNPSCQGMHRQTPHL